MKIIKQNTVLVEEVDDLKLEDVIKEQNLDKEVLAALSLTKIPLSDRKYQLNIEN